MEVKRVIRIGGSYYVALPKAWVLENSLEEGYVTVEAESGGVLRVRALGQKERKEPSIARISCGGEVLRKILSAYLKGCEVIEISLEEGCRESALQAALKAQNLLVGLELVEESKNALILQCFIREDYSVESLLYRMNAVSISMLEKAFQALSRGDEEVADEVRALDDRVDRLYFLTVRLIRGRVANPLTPPEERVRLVDLRLTAKHLEDLGDTYESLASLASRTRCELSRVELLEDAQRLVLREVLEGRGRTEEARNALRKAREHFSRTSLPAAVQEKILRALDLLEDLADLA